MPPRKRAETKPEPPVEETEAVEIPESQPEEPDETGPATAPDEGADTEAPAAPAKSDLQAVELPCADCFPNGWPQLGYAVGCEHGTWTRDRL